MTAVLQSLQICGNILSTESFSYFALRCVACDANFGQWPPFIRHLQRWHCQNEYEKESQDDNTVAANEFECKSEELKEEAHEEDEEALINAGEYIEEDNKDEVDFLKSDGEATATDDADEEWKPVAVKVKDEEEQQEESEWADYDDAGKKTKKKKGKTKVGTTSGPSGSSRKHKTFYFNLGNSEYKEMSVEFLELLEARPCLWNTTVKSRYGTRPERIAARNEMKLELRESGYSVSDKTIVSTISRILQEHKDAEQQATQNSGDMDERLMLILENCKFLNDRVEEDPKVKEKNVKQTLKTKETPLKICSDESLEGEPKRVTRNKPKKNDKSLEESCSANDELRSKMGRGESSSECSDDDSVISEYSNDSDGSSKSTTGPEIVTSKLKKNNLPYKRIRFQLLGNTIASDFIDLLREQPAIWNGTHPQYRNKEIRRSSIEAWIPHFKQQHNITFNYDDLNENWQILRVYYMNQVSRKRLSKASTALRERLSFLSARKTKQRVKCEHCDRFVMGECNYQNHLYQKHRIGECPFKCADCGGKEFRGAAELNMHIKQTHSGETDYRCSFCDRKFTQRNNMLIHEQQHTGAMNFVCSHCGQSFRRKANLIAHEVRIHLRQRNFSCSMCPKAFYTKGLLKDHVNAHLNIRNHKCPTCEKGFHSAHALMRHKQIHTEIKKYACKLCDARFHQFVGLNAHMKNRHQFVNQQQQEDADMEASRVTETVAQLAMATQLKVVGSYEY